MYPAIIEFKLMPLMICLTKREICGGEQHPGWFYGLGYRDFCSYKSYFFIIPINYFVRAWIILINLVMIEDKKPGVRRD